MTEILIDADDCAALYEFERIDPPGQADHSSSDQFAMIRGRPMRPGRQTSGLPSDPRVFEIEDSELVGRRGDQGV